MAEGHERGRILLDIARDAIAEPGTPRPKPWNEPWLAERGASFVTLRDSLGDLRGCIGTIDPHRALGDDVAHNAFAAAYRDPRFPPLQPHERDSTAVEVSVLTPRVDFPAATEAEAVDRLTPGDDGLVFEYRGHCATFLPQVWENIPEPLDFLCELRRKAGLPARFWHPDVKLSRYGVEKHR
jgi:AmmeMemoRadiSam system protein A